MDEIKKQVEELQQKVDTLMKLKDNSSQKEIFTGQVVFRGSVYDKSGNKVIN